MKVISVPRINVPLVCVNANAVLTFLIVTDPVIIVNDAAPEIVLLFPSNVPLVRVNARVAPIVRASASCTVPPTPLIVSGSSIVFPFDVMICVPDVAPKVKMPDEAANVMPVESVNDPYIVLATVRAAQVPAKPVKLTLLAVYPAVPKNVRAYVPAVKLNDMLLASERVPGRTEEATVLLYVMSTLEVPVTVRFVDVAVVQMPVLLPAREKYPVEPNAMVRTFELDEAK